MFSTPQENHTVDAVLLGALRKLAIAKEMAEETSESARPSREKMAEQFDDLRHALLSQARSLKKSVGEKTEAKPLLAMGLAFVAGIAVAKIFKRRPRTLDDPVPSNHSAHTNDPIPTNDPAHT